MKLLPGFILLCSDLLQTSNMLTLSLRFSGKTMAILTGEVVVDTLTQSLCLASTDGAARTAGTTHLARNPSDSAHCSSDWGRTTGELLLLAGIAVYMKVHDQGGVWESGKEAPGKQDAAGMIYILSLR